MSFTFTRIAFISGLHVGLHAGLGNRPKKGVKTLIKQTGKFRKILRKKNVRPGFLISHFSQGSQMKNSVCILSV